MEFVGGADGTCIGVLQVSFEVQSFVCVPGKSLCAAKVEKLEKKSVNPNNRIGVSLIVCGKALFCYPQLLNLAHPSLLRSGDTVL